MKLQVLLKDELLDDVTKVVKVNGVPVNIKNKLSLEDERAIASVIASGSFLTNEGSVPFYDKGLHNISRVITLTQQLTNLEFDDNSEEELGAYVMSGVWGQVENSFDPEMLSRIDKLTQSLILETKRTQKVKGSLGYSIKDIVKEMNNGIVDTQDVFDKVKALEELQKNEK